MIRHYPDPVLLNPAAPVSVFNDDLKAVVENLFRVLKISRGVGLAAPQIGVPLRIAVIETPVPSTPGRPDRLVLINPVILQPEGVPETLHVPQVLSEEGCLSLPGVSAIIPRAAEVTVQAQDVDGNVFKRTAAGLLSAAIQHETDHLNGILFIDHLGPVKRNMLLDKYRKGIKKFHRQQKTFGIRIAR